jgi:two-component system chemotaxis response regulator CheB
MIKVVIVDDSLVAQQFLAHILTSDPEILVVGFADDGAKALAVVQARRPDVITMDIHMPRLNGYDATRAIMETLPTPIVIVSASTSAKDAAPMFQALQAGALAVVLRPPGLGDPGYAAAARELLQTVKTMSEIKVVKRFARLDRERGAAPPAVVAAPGARIELIAIGASIGGPPVLLKILSRLPGDLAAPVLIVQHIAPGFVEGFVEWLAAGSGFPVEVARLGQTFQAGHGYVAPDGYHTGVDSGLRLILSNHASEHGSRPSVAYLFRTVAQVLGPRAVGVLLTGMGRDGAEGLKLMKDSGAVTIAQDEASSVVHGMPGEAIKLGGASYVLPPDRIAAMLLSLLSKPAGGPR